MRSALAAILGTVTIVGAFAFLLLSPGGTSDSALFVALGVLVGVVGVIGALVKIAGSESDDAVAPAPWDESGALVDRAPERSPAEYDLSGEELAAVVEDAGETARDEGTVGAGVDVVRPFLRETLLGVLVQGGTDRTAAEHALARGAWTDDATAASVLDEAVDHPGWSFLERFEAWLFPEQVVRREVRRAMQAVAAVAERELPTVPGQRAPRTVPVVEPTLEDLRRGADGHLQRAADPLGARAGSDVDGASVVDGSKTVSGELTAADGATTDDAAATGEGGDRNAGDDSGTVTDGSDERPGETTAADSGRPPSEAFSDVQTGGDPADPDGEVTRR